VWRPENLAKTQTWATRLVIPRLYELINALLASPAGQIVLNRLTWTSSPRQLYLLDGLICVWPKQECAELRDKVFRALGFVSAWNDNAGSILADCTGRTMQIYLDLLERAMPYYASQTTNTREGFMICSGRSRHQVWELDLPGILVV
jgi:hypothetical protein